ncbi:Clp protease N-terminal domain-containing protein [Streptomyces thermovulgaris]|uniref:Clp protease N-terminal domain-containing protein n=1 Tax=Streptomyces thermovulgaris TaxID=1934 RepID=UPI000A3CC673|nr:Clp protease N-terminal domain-containing protein [Streptomyces thermovulgaris]
MRFRVPRRPLPGQDASCPDGGARLSAELTAVMARARRRAVRDGDRQTDTAHLLHALLESDPEVRTALGGAPRITRLLGYLVQRSIGYGLRWQGTVEDFGALPGATGTRDGLSPVASAALEHARERAARRGEDRVRGVDLLAALVAAPRARAVEVLGRAGVDTRELADRLGTDAGDRREDCTVGSGGGGG